MAISADEREQLAIELKNFATSLNLTDDQKKKLESALTDAREKVHAYREQNPNVSKQEMVRKVAEHRSSIRERLVNFLNPEQLKTWDAEVANAREFLGQKMAA